MKKLLILVLLFTGLAHAEDEGRLQLRVEGDERLIEPIEVLAWSWGLSHGGKAAVQDLSLTKYVGVESPALMKLVATGQKVKSATLTASGTDTSKRQVFTFKNVKFTHLSTGGSGAENTFTENVTLEFDEVEYRSERDVEGTTRKQVESIKRGR